MRGYMPRAFISEDWCVYACRLVECAENSNGEDSGRKKSGKRKPGKKGKARKQDKQATNVFFLKQLSERKGGLLFSCLKSSMGHVSVVKVWAMFLFALLLRSPPTCARYGGSFSICLAFSPTYKQNTDVSQRAGLSEEFSTQRNNSPFKPLKTLSSEWTYSLLCLSLPFVGLPVFQATS